MGINYDKIIMDLERNVFAPIYFLCGEEAYYIDEISNQIEDNALSDSEKDFNQTIVYGRDADIPTILSYARRFPMMAEHQVVIIKEAQNLKQLDQLISYIEKPVESTILVFCYKYKKFDKRTKFAKTLSKSKNVLFFESPKLYDNKIPTWINSYIKKKDYQISPEACALLSESLGTNLSNIANELNKLMINHSKKDIINLNSIEECIGISKDFNVFELQNALGVKDVLKANRIINYFASNEKNHPLSPTLYSLFSYFQKLMMLHYLRDKSKNNVASTLGVNPYFVPAYVNAANKYSPAKLFKIFSDLRYCDARFKGVNNSGTPQGELLKELIWNILH